ncbi:MAG: hypothetical protein HYV08_03890 [Deltaproteobacteria bacterium]|nr:hypothetical protein [Deltaproteobacteria bacterium]MBI3077079.1 hypothetical protein [Deltaproteobacteria bacterium]
MTEDGFLGIMPERVELYEGGVEKVQLRFVKGNLDYTVTVPLIQVPQLLQSLLALNLLPRPPRRMLPPGTQYV